MRKTGRKRGDDTTESGVAPNTAVQHLKVADPQPRSTHISISFNCAKSCFVVVDRASNCDGCRDDC